MTYREQLKQAERIIALRRNVGNAAYDEQAETVLAALRARLAEPEPVFQPSMLESLIMRLASAAHEAGINATMGDILDKAGLQLKPLAPDEPVIDGYPLWQGIPKPDDTDARVQRIMEAADEFGHAQVIAATASRLPDEAAHAKLERVVRESLRPPGS